MALNLYILQRQLERGEYDAYDELLVCTTDEESAKHMSPAGIKMTRENWKYSGWASSPDDVSVVYVGKADISIPEGVVMSSYHAG